jgi:NADH:ubiquinone oxidoreductase subunit K
MLKILVTREAMLESALLQRIANQSALQSIAPWLFTLYVSES